jgi:hypothetical protein
MSIRYNNASPKSKDEIKMNRFRKNRNQAMNNIFDKYNLPRNMANNQIKRRVKYHDWVYKELGAHNYWYKRLPWKEYIEFLMNRTVFNEKKRKDMVTLAIDYKDLNILSLRSPVIIAYLWELNHLYGGGISPDFVRRFIYNELKVFGKFRKDKAIEFALKKRITFLRKCKRVARETISRGDSIHVPMNVIVNAANDHDVVLNDIDISRANSAGEAALLKFIKDIRRSGITYEVGSYKRFFFEPIFQFMKYFFPIPPHTNSTKRRAATTIQKTVRGMLNRKKVKARTARAERKETLKRKRKR